MYRMVLFLSEIYSSIYLCLQQLQLIVNSGDFFFVLRFLIIKSFVVCILQSKLALIFIHRDFEALQFGFTFFIPKCWGIYFLKDDSVISLSLWISTNRVLFWFSHFATSRWYFSWLIISSSTLTLHFLFSSINSTTLIFVLFNSVLYCPFLY